MIALEGIKVVEVGQFAAVPAAAAVLADFGATVIKIEHPVRGDALRGSRNPNGLFDPDAAPTSEWDTFKYDLCNRNKRSLALDISKPAAREILHRLIEGADVFLSNLRPRELERYGLEFGTLKQINRRLIYANLTGYGQRGPERETPGFDYGAHWARSGIAYMLNGSQGVPPFARPALGDLPSGLALVGGIAIALFVRERTGIAQEVDSSLFATGLWAAAFDIQEALATGTNADQWYKDDAPNPITNMYQSKDGRWLLLTNPQPDLYWPRFCKAIERPDLEKDVRFNSTAARLRNNRDLIAIIQETFASHTCAEWLERLTAHGVIHSLVASPAEAVADPQTKAMGYVQSVDHPAHGRRPFVMPPIQLSETPPTLRTYAPELGQHTEEVLLNLGYSWARIGQLKEEGVIV